MFYNRNFYVWEIFDADLWNLYRRCCYWQVLASRQPTLWTCSWIRASNRPLWFRSLQLTKILSGRQDDSLLPTLRVPIWTSEIESLSSRTRTVRRFVGLCKTDTASLSKRTILMSSVHTFTNMPRRLKVTEREWNFYRRVYFALLQRILISYRLLQTV